MTFPIRLNRRHKAALFLALVGVGVGLLLGASAKQSLGIALLGMAFAWAFGCDNRPVQWLFVAAGTVLAFAPLTLQWHERREAVKQYQTNAAAFQRDIPKLSKRHPITGAPAEEQGPWERCAAKLPKRHPITRAPATLSPDFFDKQKNTGKFTNIRPIKLQLDYVVRHPEFQSLSLPDKNAFLIQHVQEFASGRSQDRSELLNTIHHGPPEPAGYFKKAIAGGLNWGAVSNDTLPGDPPEPFKLSGAVTKTTFDLLIEFSGVLAVCVGLGLVFGVRQHSN